MATYYYLSIVSSTEPESVAVAQRFDGMELALSDGTRVSCVAYPAMQSRQGLWWNSVFPRGASYTFPEHPAGKHTLSDAQMEEVATQLYGELAKLDGFLCGIAGWEVDDFFIPDVTHEGYDSVSLEPEILLTQALVPGLVLPDATWKELGRPEGFEPFRPGYVWLPYRHSNR
jgi:hypothetical protein